MTGLATSVALLSSAILALFAPLIIWLLGAKFLRAVLSVIGVVAAVSVLGLVAILALPFVVFARAGIAVEAALGPEKVRTYEEDPPTKAVDCIVGGITYPGIHPGWRALWICVGISSPLVILLTAEEAGVSILMPALVVAGVESFMRQRHARLRVEAGWVLFELCAGVGSAALLFQGSALAAGVAVVAALDFVGFFLVAWLRDAKSAGPLMTAPAAQPGS